MSDDVRAPQTAPRVTVLMTVFNGERHLREAIDSVLGQSFGDFELLVVDDGSTDGTAARARRDHRRTRPHNAQRHEHRVDAQPE